MQTEHENGKKERGIQIMMKSMAKRQSCHKFIYKLPSERLKTAKWDLDLPLPSAMKNKNDIVALNDSQILRWICELNGIKDLESEVSRVKKEIKFMKRFI